MCVVMIIRWIGVVGKVRSVMFRVRMCVRELWYGWIRGE
jgi:hypothetical protein